MTVMHGKVDGVDLITRGARYRESFRRSYLRRPDQKHHLATATVTEANG
jgi:hypothetical protein